MRPGDYSVGAQQQLVRTGFDWWRELSRESIRLAGGQGSALRAGSAERSDWAPINAIEPISTDIAALIDPQFALISAQDSGGSAGLRVAVRPL